MTQRTIAVVSAGLRQPSSTRLLADRLGEAAVAALRERGDDARLAVVEAREHAHNLTNALLSGFPSVALRAAIDTVVHADALIAVSPIFSASYSGLFKTFFDVLEPQSLAGLPVLLGATGGTARHSLALEHALRPLFTYLRTVVVPTGVFAAPEDWGSGGSGPQRGLAERIEQAAGELADLVAGRGRREVADPLAPTSSFEDLLRGQ